MSTPRHRVTGSKSGSRTKASWADPVIRERRLSAIAAALCRRAAGTDGETVTQTHAATPVRITDIPRDRVEMEIFGGEA